MRLLNPVSIQVQTPPASVLTATLHLRIVGIPNHTTANKPTPRLQPGKLVPIPGIGLAIPLSGQLRMGV